MEEGQLSILSQEIREAAVGRRIGKIFSMSSVSIAIDLNPHAGSYLFIDFGPATATAFLIVRRLKALQRQSIHPSLFAVRLTRIISGLEVIDVIGFRWGLRVSLRGKTGEPVSMDIYLDRRKGNLVIRSDPKTTLLAAHPLPDDLTSAEQGSDDSEMSYQLGDMEKHPSPTTLSQALDDERRSLDADLQFERVVREARKAVLGKLRKKRSLLANLETDRERHGDPLQWKRWGDLILANLSSLAREPGRLRMKDLFHPELVDISIPADEKRTPTEMAELYFKKYAKARNSEVSIAARTASVHSEIENLNKTLLEIDEASRIGDAEKIESFLRVQPSSTSAKVRQKDKTLKEARRFISSDGFEILVGKKATDNDTLTFKLAKSLDLWFHAADYPGSHVIVRKTGRVDIPNRTIVEAARLAGFYSDARNSPKADIRYTERKHVSKPRRAAPGLVSLSSFRTILVEATFPETVSKAND